MASSAGETIVAAMVAALNKPAPSSRPFLTYRNRIDAVAGQELPFAVLYFTEEESAPVTRTTIKRTRKVNLELQVAAEEGSDQKLDPLYVYVVQTLQADADLAALVRLLFDGRMQQQTEASTEDVSVALIQFEATYYTSLTDPTVLIPG